MIQILFLICIILIIAGVFVIAVAFKKLHKYLLMKDTPTSTIRSIAMGVVEINGRAFSTEYLLTPHSQTRCVYYRYELEEYQERTTTDADGHTDTTYEWVTIDKGKRFMPFYARDGTGQVLIEPAGAEYRVPKKKMVYRPLGGHRPRLTIGKRLSNWWHDRETVLTISKTGWYVFYPHEEFPISPYVGDIRSHEYYIEPEGFVYVLGTAKSARDVPGNVVIKKGRTEKTFVIANKPEEELLDEIRGWTTGFFILGGASILVGLSIIFAFLAIS